ncbi:MAG: hypothetical protein LCI03_00990 [Actinobacteria bacterium]|nr:hypothetical protein [Actinomycetota bacterium]
MSKILGIAAAAAGILAVPFIALLTLLGLAGNAIACAQLPAAGIAPTAPVPAPARLWIALTHASCGELPEPWIAAVMSADSAFVPTAHTASGRGLLALSDEDWQRTYGARWDADLNKNHVPDVFDPEIHATVAGTQLCHLLDTTRQLRTARAQASAPALASLEALALAHHAGVSALASYPDVPSAALTYLSKVTADATAWTPTSAASPTSTSTTEPSAVAVDAGCVASLGSVGTVVVPPGTSTDVATAVRNSLDLVGTRSGWNNKCDRLACRAYGFANSGYESASVHWSVMAATGHAHPGDRCPPVGAFVFWATRSPDGHVALVVASDTTCSPDRIKLVSNDVLNNRTGFDGGVYLVTLTEIESGFVTRTGYRGWSDPVCAGVRLTGNASAG